MRQIAVAAALVALVAGPAAAVVPAAAVTARASSGQGYEGTIDDPGDLHSFLLEDFAPQPVSISLKASKGSTLLPDISLYDPAETDVTGSLAAFRKDGAKSVTVKNATAILLPGRYVLQVKGKTGSTGGYLLKVTAKVTKSVKGAGNVGAGDTDVFEFLAPTESLVTLKVAPGSGSILQPLYLGVAAPPCVAASLAPSTKVGQATFTAPLTGTYEVEIDGDGGTAGTFNWSAKVKPAKPSKKPFRVNGGAAAFPEVGPPPGILTARSGQEVYGFDVDPTGLFWREVRKQGGGPNGDKNSIQQATLKGGGLPAIANNIFVDADPDPRAFAIGPLHAVLFDFDGADLYTFPRNGDAETVLVTTLGTVTRVLADREFAYAMRDDGIRRYAHDQSDASGVSTDPSYLYLEMVLGGTGLVYAAEDTGGDLVIVTVDRDGNTDTPLATVSPNPGLLGLAARGPDAYFAVPNMSGGATLLRASTCDPGSAIAVCADFENPVSALAVDDANVYVLEDDPLDGGRIYQVPRGGGVATVLLRGNGTDFTLVTGNLEAAGGYVYVQADDGGNDAFYRVKRR